MKLTTFFLIITLIQVSAKGYSQKITLDEQNKSLEKVFEAIEKQSNYVFFYDNKDVKSTKVKVAIKNGSIQETLKECFKNLPLTYNIVEKNIVVSRKDEPNNSDVNQVTFQKIKGKITDTTGAPLLGVSIKIKNSSVGTISDKDGNYTISVPSSEAVLVFSCIGYITREIKVGDQTSLNVTIHEGKNGLDEIVIVGYGTQKAERVTGSITTLKVDSLLRDRPVSTVSDLLIGEMPGLQVSIGSGQPGAATSFNLRGGTDIGTDLTQNTINEGGPLILVDNVPFNGGLNLLNPEDIESITTLNDAGAAAIYGGRSAFGVVLITTKKGKKNQKITFNYNNNYSIVHAEDLPEIGAPSQFFAAMNAAGTISYWGGQNVATWQQLENDYIANPGKYPGGISYVSGLGYQLAATNPLKSYLNGYAPQFNNTLSVSGGNDKTTFRLSLGSADDNGIIDPATHLDGYKKYSVSSAISTDVNKWLTTQLNINYYNGLATQSSQQTEAFYIASTDGSLTANSPTITAQNGTSGINGTPNNLTSLGYPNTIQNADTRITGRVIAKPVTGLTITGDYTVDNVSTDSTSYAETANIITSANFQPIAFGNGNYVLANSSYIDKVADLFGTYTKSFGKNNFTLLFGYNQESETSTELSASRTVPISTGNPALGLATGPILASNSYGSYTLQSYLGRFNYDYDGKYLFQLNARDDGSSNFPPNHRFGLFGSGSVAWNIMKEDFMQTVKPILSDLKLRASYGSVGNQNAAPNYGFIPQLLSSQPYWLQSSSSYLVSLSPPSAISTDYTWETVTTLDFGVDFGLLNNRLTGTFDWYQRITSGILAVGAIPLPAVFGTSAPLQNTATLTTKGLTAQISWHDHIGQVRYSISANVYNSNAVVTKFGDNPTDLLSTYYVGEKQGTIWGYETNGFFTVNDFVPGTLNSKLTGGTLKPGIAVFQGELPNPGDVMFKDFNHDGVVYNGQNTLANHGDLAIIGNNTPQYQFGGFGSVGYKSFDFSFAFNGVGKQTDNIVNALTYPNVSEFTTIYQGALNYWTPTNLNAHFGRIYDLAAGNQSINQQTQSGLLQNGAFLKISNLALSYTVPKTLMDRLHLVSLRIFCSVENPFLFDHLPKGVDPTLSSQSNGLEYPFLRTTSVGANLTF